jgi:hypothetical protein
VEGMGGFISIEVVVWRSWRALAGPSEMDARFVSVDHTLQSVLERSLEDLQSDLIPRSKCSV